MLSDFVRTERGRLRYLATPFRNHLDGYIAHRRSQGFASESIRIALLQVTSFGEYLVDNGFDTLSKLNESHFADFVNHYTSIPRRYGPKRQASLATVSTTETLRGNLRGLLVYLRSMNAVLIRDETGTPYDPYLKDYILFLQVHRGLAPLTIEQHRRWAGAFFSTLSLRDPFVELSRLSAREVQEVVLQLAEHRGKRCRQIMTTTIESLLRYLRSTAEIPSSCTPFLPRLKTYALASLPCAIDSKEVERMLERTAHSTFLGRRNYALLVLISVYGLRATEVVSLRLDDLNWRRGMILVRQTKTRRDLELPMVTRVRDALVDYLRNGRPATDDRRVFQKVHAPRGPITRGILYDVVRKALLRADIKASQYGSHMLRHTRATSLIRSGQPLKVVGDLLGHRVPEATLLYCKLAVEDLREVALELPEVSA